MHESLQLLLLGCAGGSLYALLASGLIITFRSSRALNFAHGGVAIAGTYTCLNLISDHGWHTVPAIVVGVLTSVALGVCFAATFMRRLRHADALARIVCTLGLLIFVQEAIPLLFGNSNPAPVQLFPTDLWRLPFGSPRYVIGVDQVILVGIAGATCAMLWALYRFTRFGRETRAVADNEQAAQLLGVVPTRLELLNWALASGLAGLAGILLSSRQQPSLAANTQMLVISVAVALVANFKSFGWLLVVAMLFGGGQGLLLRYGTDMTRVSGVPGWDQALPLVVIIAVVLFGGRSIVPRGATFEQPPPVARYPHHPWSFLGAVGLVGIAWYLLGPESAIFPTTISLIGAVASMSLVVVTGYCGQISLGQMSLAAVAALSAGRLLGRVELTPPVALIIGGLAAVPVAVLVGAVSVRVRGVNLAVVSLSVAVVLDATIFSSQRLTGASTGLSFPVASLFGVELSGITSDGRGFGVFTLAVMLVVAASVMTLRRSMWGARLLAVRANERGAAAQGLSVAGTKLLAFAVAGFVVGVAGVLRGYYSGQLAWPTFASPTSIMLVALLYLGGVTSVGGAMIAGLLLADGGLGTHLLGFEGTTDRVIGMVSGVGVMLVVSAAPGGLAALGAAQRSWVARVATTPRQAGVRGTVGDAV